MKKFRPKIIKSFLIALVALTVIAVPLLDNRSADAAVNAQLYLSPSSKSVTVGSNLVLNVMLNAGGNQVITFQAGLNYSTAYFSSATVTTPSGSPFTLNPNASDIYSPGTLRIARGDLDSNGSSYNGSVATITLKTKKTGSTAISFGSTCASSSDLSACSTVIEKVAPNSTVTTNILASTQGGTYTIAAKPVATSSGTTSSTPTTSGSSSSASSSSTTTKPATPAAPKKAAAEPTVTEETNTASGVVRITVVDSQGKPVEGAVVTLGDISGTTDKNGVVTLSGLLPGQTSTGTIKYKDVSKSISVDVSSTSSESLPQTEKFTINATKSSAISPVTIGIVGAVALLIIGFIVLGGPGRGMKGLHGGFSSHTDIPTVSPAAIVTSEDPKPLVTPAKAKPLFEAHKPEPAPASISYKPAPAPSPAPQPPVSKSVMEPPRELPKEPAKVETKPAPEPKSQPKPEPKPTSAGFHHGRLDPMSPGTVVRPSTGGFHATKID